jgi:peroxiredoxin
VTTVAIVAQKPDALQKYLEEHPLPFRVLIDQSRTVIKAYGVWHRFGLDAWNMARPALFLIARDRSIVRSFVSRRQDQFPGHGEILEWLAARERSRRNTHDAPQ